MWRPVAKNENMSNQPEVLRPAVGAMKYNYCLFMLWNAISGAVGIALIVQVRHIVCLFLLFFVCICTPILVIAQYTTNIFYLPCKFVR